MSLLRSLFTRGLTSQASQDKQLPEKRLISDDYSSLNSQLHATRQDYGTSGQQWASVVEHLFRQVGAESILDYGCGKQTLARALPNLPVKGYDPAIPALSAPPIPAHVVVCTDVLEHVEPEYIENVLDHLCELTQRVALITVATRPAIKKLADGRNAHLTVRPLEWWRSHFESRFHIVDIREIEGYEFSLILQSRSFDGPVKAPARFAATPITTDKSTAPAEQGATSYATLKYRAGVLKYFTPNEATVWRVKTLFTKEPHTIQWLERMDSGSTLLDIGANVGMYSIFAAALQNATVFAFEPESQNFALINSNIALNEFNGRVIAYPLAISDSTKGDKLYLSDFGAGGSCHSFGEEVGFDLKKRKSPFAQGAFSVSIDELVAQGTIPVPEYIKVDVDGFEHKVIQGALKTLENVRVKSVLIELNTHLPEHQQAIKQLQDLGFAYDPVQVERALRKDGAFSGVGEYIFDRRVNEDIHSTLTQRRRIHLPQRASSRQVMQHVVDRINATAIQRTPFPYAVVDNVFPEDFYQRMLENFPASQAMTSLSESGRVTAKAYNERTAMLFTQKDMDRMPESQKRFWQDEVVSWLYSEPFLNAVYAKFAADLEPRVTKILRADQALTIMSDSLLVDDQTNYEIGPHTDAAHRLITLLFYLPKDDSQKDIGTSVYVPENPPDFTCWGGQHYARKGFRLIETVQFLPNRLLVFPKTERSFHGVEKIHRTDVQRHLLITNIRTLNSVTH